MNNFRNVTIKCEAEKLNELLQLLDVDYVEEIIICRTQEEFNHDYQGKTPIGLLDEDEELELDGIEIKLDDFEDDEEPTWELALSDFDDDPIGEDYEAFIDDLITKASKLSNSDFDEDDDFEWDNQEGYYESDVR